MSHTSELASFSAVKLKQMIQKKQISPVEITQIYIDRIIQIDPKINSFCAKNYEQALVVAKYQEQQLMAGQARGLLFGLPIGIKDLEDTQNLNTTYGSLAYQHYVPNADNELVQRVRHAGAIILGKTNVPDMGAGANTRNPVWGATGNPFNPSLNAGGSSGGSAAALAASLAPLCTGSDTGGSLRIPAALCGIYGLRPSAGLVPSQRKPLGWTPISVVGPMGRNVEDTWLQLAATIGLSKNDPLSYDTQMSADIRDLPPVDLSKLRVAYTEDFGCCEVDNDIRQVFRNKIQKISKLFQSCEEIQFNLDDAHRCFDVLRAEAFVAGLQNTYEKNPDLLGPNPRMNYEMGANMKLTDCIWAHKTQTQYFKDFQKLFDQYDLILSPVTPVSPFSWQNLYLSEVNGKPLENYYRWLSLTYVVTLMTNPALSFPLGRDHLNMPFGLQMIAGFREDTTLLRMADALAQHCEHDPDLAQPQLDLSALMQTQTDFKTGIVDTSQISKIEYDQTASAV
ncbi:amidase [Acinetobacter courvalinii]|uniref:amidase n=1 Tax=Acinetobacter courvalinii TaxID=280147 RepID=UPI0021CF10A6|nr:amidase [Acinetobacter courvalinii]MCU4639159.1 amidase [Acinetobacter courvalinii]